jgi:2-keto-4-pentenoate hydratase/2-oxohepta-3-ene-1,7-dioic acid hydratase in catechol pathway
MRLYTYQTGKQQKVGAERDGRLIELPFPDMITLIRAGTTGLAKAKATLKTASARAGTPLHKARLLAPIPKPSKIYCSGLNYKSHIKEEPGAKFLEDPRFFGKFNNCVIGPGEAIRHPGLQYQVDYEVELAVIIGKRMFRANESEIMSNIFGYTIFHDVSSRWVQFKDANEMMGKNFDTFAPMGPCIVTADEIPDPAKLRLRLLLNDEVMQDETNQDWCFSLPRLIAWLNSAMTLDPGDVVTTGTPAGVGFFRNPKVFLKPGDICTLEIESIGQLVNSVVAI